MFIVEKEVSHSFRYNRGLNDFYSLLKKSIAPGEGWGTVWVFLVYRSVNT